ncbi:hypothetical protein ENSA5_03600 [Enhygromyxa salina]|uniref:Uncharacterized protein n=1 Tax=Enhygromyxa salina TaxID=215803 RepID=A0A2S9YJY0_9BACT|nr:hypothetical protein [Enhygromyxa salina]PRQ05370.1 hypothetical protein ENSA5_03600 [Enhygromyxa salina]
MRSLIVAPLCALWLCACVSEPVADDQDGDEATDASSSDSSDSADASGDGDGDANGDGDGDEPPPAPADMPTPTGACPSFVSGDATFSPASIAPRSVKLWAGDNPEPGGMLVLYWHAYTSAPDEAAFTLSLPVIDAIVAAGGVVAAPYSADDVGEFPWFVVNLSDRPDDMLLADEIVACAVEEVGIDPRRIHSTGMSAGGLQTTAFAMARSRYIASAASFSGGAYTQLPFEDPSNHFAAMIIHGGDNDVFGGQVNFKTLSTAWFNQLTDNGHFAFMCDHGGAHTIPPDYGADVVNFFFAHPFGTEPSPYAEGLPPELPDDCSL